MSLKPRFLYFFVLPFLALVQCSQASQEEIESIPDQGFLKALTVSFQSYKAATANPADSIWTE